MIILAYTLSGFSLLMSVLFLIHSPKPPFGFVVLLIKLTGSALSPFWAVVGIVGAAIGGIVHALWAIPMGVVGASVMIWYVWRCAREHKGFESVFDAGWSDQLPPQQAKLMVQRRWTWYLRMRASREPSWERDLVFHTVLETERELLCDVWRPSNGHASGLALVFLHGGAWAIGDKDFGTRPFFRHLVSQGHAVMDVAYRLTPEVDIYGMIGDAKYAIAWIKDNASRFRVNPEKIVVGGASAGGHLALLAGYAPHHPKLTPEDLRSTDLSVCGIVSYYGPTDLVAGHEVYDVRRFSAKVPPVPIGTQVDSREAFNFSGRLDILLGGHPDEVPDMYRLACPTTHVHRGSPPTLLMQGDQDFLVPVSGTRKLHAKLVESGVPAINVVFPWTDHAFDLMLPQTSPAAQSALYDVDRFLALLAYKD